MDIVIVHADGTETLIKDDQADIRQEAPELRAARERIERHFSGANYARGYGASSEFGKS